MGHVVAGIEKYAAHLRQTQVDPLLGPATISVGVIHGGVGVNTVPDRCGIEIDRRLITGEDPIAESGRLLKFLTTEGRIDFPIELSTPYIRMPALSPKGSDEIQKLLGAAINAVRGSHRVHPVPYGTDAATLAAAGIPSVVFGPGDIAKAHTVDEWVPLDEVEAASSILYGLACSME
jgi:acetylornithine deacetylase